MRWTLQRVARTPRETFGVLITPAGRPLCLTLEDAWRFNRVNESCIPAGVYRCEPVDSPRFGKTWVVDVPWRSEIIFHPGNTEEDTRGCILVATSFGDGEPLDVAGSGVAFERLRLLRTWQRFDLEVRDP